MAEYYICGKCEDLCDKLEVDVGGPEEFWGMPVHRAEYEWRSSCCLDDCYTPEEWRENGWDHPKALGHADLVELEFIEE